MGSETISAKDVLAQIRAIAMADVTELVQVEDGQLVIRSTKELSGELRNAICSVEKSAGSLKVKFYDKLKALELLGKMLGLFDRQGSVGDDDNNLLETILESTKEVIPTHDLPEIQQAAAAGDDMVEQTGLS